METTKLQYIDLGLPSGTMWATCNVGANSAEEYGDYYNWDEAMKLNVTLPSKEQIDELFDKCTSAEWTEISGVKGCIVKGPNGNVIFLPAAGLCCGSSIYNAGVCGYYWSSSSDSNSSDGAYYLSFGLYRRLNWCNDYHHAERSVRPVKNKEE